MIIASLNDYATTIRGDIGEYEQRASPSPVRRELVAMKWREVRAMVCETDNGIFGVTPKR